MPAPIPTMAGERLTHAPPDGVTLSVTELVDTQIVDWPDIVGVGLTVTTIELTPHGVVYITVAVPAAVPVIVDVVLPVVTVTAPVPGVVVQVPPVVASDTVMLAPLQKPDVPPLIAAGALFTVNVAVPTFE